MSIIDNSAQEQQEASKNWRTLEAQIDKIVDPTNGDLDLKNSNANINGLSVQGKLQQFANEASKIYSLKNLVNKKAAKAHMEGDIHIHDLDYYATKTTTCDQLDLKELFERGIWNEHGYIRPPKSIGTAAQLAAVVLQSHQNQQHGGQSINNFDFDLAPYVKISYEKKLAELQKNKTAGDLEKLAWKEVEDQTLQAMEGFIHNINTMHSRGGGQVVFASINFGLDTTREGRLVSKCLMQAQANGLGHGETPIFPILCFKVKEGVNYNPEDPNYDLFKMTFEVTARRLFPNWVFEDAPFNLAGLDMSSPERMALTSCASMGCRTRLYTDVNGDISTSNKRGNASFTTINLPRLGLLAVRAKDAPDDRITEFFRLLDEKLELCHDQLLERYKWQCSASPEEFMYMYQNNTVMGSDSWHRTGNIEDCLKHFSLSIGFIGLAEALVALTGFHHGENVKSRNLGLRIVKHMRMYCDRKAEEEHLNWTLLGTPAEGLAGRFTKMDRERFGVVTGVNDREFYTNSSHVPVYYPISAFEKIDIEAPYHALENAGHIAYIELDGDPSQNLQAVETLVRHMKEAGVGYGAINHPIDTCQECGYSAPMTNSCPRCGSTDIEQLRRITGYLVGTLSRWNPGKKAEEAARVKHSIV